MSYFFAVAAGVFIGIFVTCAAALSGSRPDRATLVGSTDLGAGMRYCCGMVMSVERNCSMPSDNLLMPYGVPTPKYGIGSKFWVAGIETKISQLPCPDCKGEQVWKMTSPAGGEHTVTCPRCGGGHYSTIGADQIPSLKFVEHIGVARLFTVGGIDIRSHGYSDHDGRDTRISYYNSPNGGTTYHECDAYDSEEAALTIAKLRAEKLNAKVQADPSHLEKIRFAQITFAEAVMKAAHDQASSAWWAYIFLREDIEATAENNGEGYTKEELCNELARHLAFDHDHRKSYRPPCPEPLYEALQALVERLDEMEGQEGMTDWKFAEVALTGPEVVAARAALKTYRDSRRPLPEKDDAGTA